MKFYYRKLAFTSILIGSLLFPLISNAAQAGETVRALSAGKETVKGFSIDAVKSGVPKLETRLRALDVVIINPRCKEHYMYLHQDNVNSSCIGWVQSGGGSVGGRAITGGYTCRFMENFPPDVACPPGSTIERNNDVLYYCNSSNPIDASQLNCYQAPGYNFTVTYVWENDQNRPPGMANGFHCQVGTGSPGNVCTAAGALDIGGGNLHNDRCCVFLEEE